MTDEEDPKKEEKPEEKDPKQGIPASSAGDFHMGDTIMSPGGFSSLSPPKKPAEEKSEPSPQTEEPSEPGMKPDPVTENPASPSKTDSPQTGPPATDPGTTSGTSMPPAKDPHSTGEIFPHSGTDEESGQYAQTIVPDTSTSEKTPPSSRVTPGTVGFNPITHSPGSDATPPSSRPPTSRFSPPSTIDGGQVRDLNELDMLPKELRQYVEDPQRRLNQYILSEQVGAGGMGTVWKAWDIKLSRWVAIKFLSLSDQESIIRFQREAKMTARLRHPNIAGVFEVNEAGGTHFLVMEFIEGVPFHKAEMTIPEFVQAFIKVCDAMNFAHENDTVHRDLKPANILVKADGEPFVTDFGLAKGMHGDSSLSITGSIMGTPAYMSPEQATGSLKEIDAQSDVYSLGATLYALLTKRAPFKADNPTALLFKVCSEEPDSIRSLNPEIPPSLENIVFKAMAKKKEDRYESASAMGEDLARFLQDAPVDAKKRKRSGKRSKWPVAACLLVLFGGGIGAAWQFGYLDGILNQGEGGGGTGGGGIGTGGGDNGNGGGGGGTVDNGNGGGETGLSPEDLARLWKSDQFLKIQNVFSLDYFESPPPEKLDELRILLTKMPGGVLTSVRNWFESQRKRIPRVLWEKEHWMGKKKEASRYQAWCTSLLSLLKDHETDFEKIRNALKKEHARFAPVVAFEGIVNLKIYVWPYAEIRELRVNDNYFVKNGQLTGKDLVVRGKYLSTPLVIEKLEIGKITIVLTHPELGEQTSTIPSKWMKDGKSYLVSVKMGDPNTFRFRALP
jgi:hypothetical protein